MASIIMTTQIQLAQIETNKQEEIAKLNAKFASADTAKTSFGYIGIISVSVFCGSFILNDLFKLGFLAVRRLSGVAQIKSFFIRHTHETPDAFDATALETRKADLHAQKERLYSSQIGTRLSRVHVHLMLKKYKAKSVVYQV